MKRHIFILSAFAAFVFAGCDTEKIAKLDNSVDAKINALIDGYVDDLIASEYGWIASIQTSEGYYRYWMKFYEDNVVEMYTDNTHYPEYRTEKDTSIYSFIAYQRPTLVFNSYTYISIPNDPDDLISHGDNNAGLVTDFEFEVDRYDRENKIFHMKGRFNKVNAIFRPASEADMKGAAAGKMMDVVTGTYQNPKWMSKYIYGITPDGVEVAVKLYDARNMYVFTYDGRSGENSDSFSYFNTEVDESNDLYFPEPIEAGKESITGMTYGTTDFVEFKTASGATFPLTVSSTPPAIPLEDLFGELSDGKMYNALRTTGDIVAALGSGVTYSALNLMDKFFFTGNGVNIVSTYDQVYYFSRTEDAQGRINETLTMTMTPIGLGIDFGTYTSITSFPTATYVYALSEVDWNTLTFRTGVPQLMDAGAREYYNNNITRPIVDGLGSRRLKLQWSEVGVQRGMVVELRPQNLSDADTHANIFIPPAILTTR
jgi:hypothetical protein